MSLFRSKKRIRVSSTAYNLAGALEDRTSFLRTSVARAVLQGDPRESLGSNIVRSQLNGPSLKRRGFFRWAKKNFPQGKLEGRIYNRYNLNAAQVSRYIPRERGETLIMQAAHVDEGDLTYWAEQHLMRNNPSRLTQDWSVEMDGSNAVISHQDGTSEIFVPDAGYDPKGLYVIAYYTVSDRRGTGTKTIGEQTRNDPQMPATTGFQSVQSVNYTEDVLLTETVTTTITELGQEPVVQRQATTTKQSFQGTEETLEKVEINEAGDAGLLLTKDVTSLWIRSKPRVVSQVVSTSSEDGAGTVTTIDTRTESITTVWDHRTDTHEGIVVDNTVNRQDLLIYRIGSGIVELDLLAHAGAPVTEFYPVIPLRVNGKSIRDYEFSDEIEEYKKAYRRATGRKVDELLDNIEENESIDDIDYAFMVHGVELNTMEAHGKRYIYEFLKGLQSRQVTSVGDVQTWVNQIKEDYDQSLQDLQAWETLSRQLGVAMPVMQPRILPNTNTLELKSPEESKLDYRMMISWISIEEQTGQGLGKPEAKKGDLWWEAVSKDVSFGNLVLDHQRNVSISGQPTFDHVRLYWQDSADSYRWLDVYGLVHENFVYRNKSVLIKASEALDDTDETGFIIPLNDQSLKRMPLVAANDLASSSMIVVFNSFAVFKQRWYQRGIFRLIFGIILSVIFFPAGVGLLGANLAVGAALGLSGTAALVAGAVANAIAAVVLTTIIQKGAVSLFGEKLGSIIAAIALFFTFQFVANYQITGSWTFNWGEMMRAENLLRLVDSVSGGVQQWVQGEISNISGKHEQAYDSYRDSMQEIERRTLDLLGSSGIHLDPLGFLSMQDSSLTTVESSATFLSRTLLTGSDIADMSFNMISDFAELSLQRTTAIG